MGSIMISILWMRKWELREFKWLAQDYTAERHWAGLDPLLLPLDYRAEVEDQEYGVLACRGLGSKGFEMGGCSHDWSWLGSWLGRGGDVGDQREEEQVCVSCICFPSAAGA